VKLERQTVQAIALSEAREQELVKRNGYKSRQRHLKCLVVKRRYTQQRQGEQNEINGDAEQHWAHAFCVAARPSLDLSLLHAATPDHLSTDQPKEFNRIR
jgi:hypothetical protein